jgi:hypothetical protein
MLTTCGILGFVVLYDAMLFARLDVLPIGFEGYIEQRIAAKR